MMDRLTQTAMMAAALGAVVVTAGVVVSFQAKLDNAAQQSANSEQAEAPAKQTNQAAIASDDGGEEVVEAELDLSEYGNPVYETSLFSEDSGAEEPAVEDNEQQTEEAIPAQDITTQNTDEAQETNVTKTIIEEVAAEAN